MTTTRRTADANEAKVALSMPAELMPGLGPWCLCRFLNGAFCGPLSAMTTDPRMGSPGLGFPDGEIGFVTTFATAEEAASAEEAESRDVPTLMGDLHFSAEEYNAYDGKTTLVYDGGNYQVALVAVMLKRGIYASMTSGTSYMKASVRCRPKATEARR